MILTVLMFWSGCWLPFADLDQSLSLLTAEKMGNPVWSFTLITDYDKPSAIYFLPENDPQPNRGYLISHDGAYLDPEFYVGRENGMTQAQKENFDWPVPRPATPRPVMFPNNAPKNIIMLLSNNNFKPLHNIKAIWKDPPLSGSTEDHTTPLVQNQTFPLVASGVHYWGETIPQASALLLAPNSVVYSIHDGDVFDLNIFPNPGNNYNNLVNYLIPGLSAELSATSQGTIFRFETDGIANFDGVICFNLGNSKYKTYRYNNNVKIKEYSFEGVVESVLNNATLMLVRNGSMYEVYKGDETLVSRFPAGTIIFCHEVWDGQWWSVFSRTLVRTPSPEENNKQKEIKVDVWYIPSDMLHRLNY